MSSPRKSRKAPSNTDARILRRRLAEVLKLVGQQVQSEAAVTGHDGAPVDGGTLAPRLRQTLERLLQGDAEKQIAARLKLSPHTIHVYVKALYKRFGVCSRAELLARFVKPH